MRRTVKILIALLPILIAVFVAGAIGMIALDHNPQGSYCAYPEQGDGPCVLTSGWYVLVALWFGAGFVAALLVVAVVAVAVYLIRGAIRLSRRTA